MAECFDKVRVVGKKLAESSDVVAVDITVRLSDGSLVSYKSNEDPAFFGKCRAYECKVGLYEDDE